MADVEEGLTFTVVRNDRAEAAARDLLATMHEFPQGNSAWGEIADALDQRLKHLPALRALVGELFAQVALDCDARRTLLEPTELRVLEAAKELHEKSP